MSKGISASNDKVKRKKDFMLVGFNLDILFLQKFNSFKKTLELGIINANYFKTMIVMFLISLAIFLYKINSIH